MDHKKTKLIGTKTGAKNKVVRTQFVTEILYVSGKMNAALKRQRTF